jgi:phage terminase large subunit
LKEAHQEGILAGRASVSPTVVGFIDKIGIGKGISDRCKELHRAGDLRFKTYGIQVSEKANEEDDYFNLRSEGWWFARTLFETGAIDIDPNDEDLAAELATLRYKRTSSGKIQVESKKEAKDRGIPSPNRADALMLSFLGMPKRYTKATWGR